MNAMRILLAGLVIAMSAATGLAQGMIVPVRPDLRVSGNWAVKSHNVHITVREQVASVGVDQEFINTGSGMIEVEYFFPVPPEAAIDSMTLLVNGKEYAAKLYKADEARKIYEDIVRTKKDPALLEYAGCGLFRTKAFPLEPGKPAKVVVTYKNICRKDRYLVEVLYPLNTGKFSAKPIEEVEIKLDVKAQADITALYSPSHDLKIERQDSRQVVATYSAKNVLPTSDFQVYYKAADEAIGATLLTCQPDPAKDGYFMMLVSPNPRTAGAAVTAKDVVLVMDHSGSMGGSSMDQVKAALRYVLKNLNRGDRFNIISYNDSVDQFFGKLSPADAKTIEDANDRVDRIEASGGTNIAEALEAAMRMLAGEDRKRPKYILFLTDGQPTIGKTAEPEILDITRKANTCEARVFAFGAGYDVNVRLLDKLAEQNSGKSDYVKPKEAIDAKISSLYNKIKSPVMTDLSIVVKGLKLRDVYPRKIGDLFDGDQIVLVGRYEGDPPANSAPGGFNATLVVTGQYEGREKGFEYPVTVQPAGKSRYDFVEKLWAIRRVGFLMDEMQLHGQSKEVMDELIRLSKEYGIMTPYTSFLADERTVLKDTAGHRAKLDDFARENAGLYEGRPGQMDAKARQQTREAVNLASAATAPAGAAGPGGRGSGVNMIGNANGKDYDQGKPEVVAGVRQAGNQALYRRGNVWIAANASGVDLEKDAAKIKDVQQYSPEYFDLVRANSATNNLVLSQQQAGEELIVNFQGQLYRIRG